MSFGGGSSDTSGSGSGNSSTTGSTSNLVQGGTTTTPANAAQLSTALNTAGQTFYGGGNPTTRQGFGAINQAAANGEGAYAAATPSLEKTLNGSYLSAGNPYFAGMVKQLGQALQPQVASGFEGNGRYGGGASAAAYDSALANEAGSLAYQNYGAERANQLNAAAQLPSYVSGSFTPGQQQVTAGYTPLNQYIDQLKAISPGSTTQFGTTSSGSNNSATNFSGSTGSSGSQFKGSSK
jgi:hypothetical protein